MKTNLIPSVFPANGSVMSPQLIIAITYKITCLLWKARLSVCDWVTLTDAQLFLRGWRSLLFFICKQKPHGTPFVNYQDKNAIEDAVCYTAWGPLFILELYSKKQWHCPPNSLLHWQLCKFSSFCKKESLLKMPNIQGELRWAELKSRFSFI